MGKTTCPCGIVLKGTIGTVSRLRKRTTGNEERIPSPDHRAVHDDRIHDDTGNVGDVQMIKRTLTLPVFEFVDPERRNLSRPYMVISTPGIRHPQLWDGYQWTELPMNILEHITEKEDET